MLIIAHGWGDGQSARLDGRQLGAKVKIRLQLSILFILDVLLWLGHHRLATATLLNRTVRYVVERIVLLLGHHKEAMRRLIAEEDLIGVPFASSQRRLAGRSQYHRAVVAVAAAGHGHAREVGALPHAAGGGAAGEVLGAVAYANRARITGRPRGALHGSRWRGGTASGRPDAIAKTAPIQRRAASSQDIQQLAFALLRRALCGHRRAIAASGPVSGWLLGNHI